MFREILGLVILAPLAAAVTIFGGYLFLLTFASFFLRTVHPGIGEPVRFAVVIPAHNEELGIAQTISTIRASQYPPNLFKVFVIADNCSDDTAQVAAAAGAAVAVRSDPDNPGKGQAIEWFLSTYRDQLLTFGAIALIDADALVDAHFLLAMSSKLHQNCVHVVQGYYGVSNPDEHWRSALTYAGFATVNHLRPAGQEALGVGPVLKGCGMAFDRALLLEYGWPAYSVVEDMELSLRLALDGERVHYHPDARVLSAMPSEASQAVSQRRRWEGGRAQLVRAYAPRFLKAFLRRPRWAYVCLALEVMLPPLSFLASLQVLFLVLSAAFLRPGFMALAMLNLAATGAYVAAGLWQVRAPGSVWRALALAPVFVLWKLPIYLKVVLLGADSRWIRTDRRGTPSADSAPDHGSERED